MTRALLTTRAACKIGRIRSACAWICAAIACCLAVAGVFGTPQGQSSPKREAQPAARTDDETVEIQMQNIKFRLARHIDLEVRSLRGRLKRTKPDRHITFDDINSFIVEVDTAEVAITPASL